MEFAVYTMLFSIAAGAVAAIILERKDRVYKQGFGNPGNTFLVFCVIFIFTDLIMIISGLLHKAVFISMHLLVPGGLVWLYMHREKQCKEFREYQRQQMAERALAWEKALKREPENALLHAQIGEVYETLGNLEKAQLYYEQASRLDPAYRENWDLLRLKRENLKKDLYSVPELPPKNLWEKILRLLNKPL